MEESSFQLLPPFAEGFGLAFSPCILPVLPFILASAPGGTKLRPFMIILGFIASFTLFALLSRQIVLVSGIPQDSIQKGSYVILLRPLGAVMLIPQLDDRFSALTQRFAGQAQRASSGSRFNSDLGGFLVGCLIGVIWTPCAGPLMAAALLQVLQAKTDFHAAATVLAFGSGAGIPMLLVALFGQYLTAQIRFISRHAIWLKRGMGVLVIIFALLGLSGFNIGMLAPAANEEVATTETKFLPQSYAAPQISGITKWFNSDALDMQGLKGKVVLVDFWTYSCINCIRTLPHVKEWYSKYKDDGLVVIGVHTPEFAFEFDPGNVAAAIQKFGITYPVAMDNDFATWKNFSNQYWPAHYLIDRDGRVVYTHFGEGNYNITENNIRKLLGLEAKAIADQPEVSSSQQTPETYLGRRAEREVAADAADIPLHHWQRRGHWQKPEKGQYIESGGKGDVLEMHAAARKVFLVMESANGLSQKVTVRVNGKAMPGVDVKELRLYDIYDGETVDDLKVEIEAQDKDLRLYAFTFES